MCSSQAVVASVLAREVTNSGAGVRLTLLIFFLKCGGYQTAMCSDKAKKKKID